MPGAGSAHRRSARMGPELRHHRFPDSARYEVSDARGVQSLSGPTEDVKLRPIRRAVALGCSLAMCMVRYWLMRLRGPLTMEQRAQWVQGSARQVLRSMGIRYRIEGETPKRGLVVSNHLSYVDVVVLSAAMPCIFVAKIEVGGWPFFGMAARIAGTLFVDRSSTASAISVAEQMKERLKLPNAVPVLLFPEATSTDGRQVLRFHSRLIDPATSLGVPISAAAIRYVPERGVEERELCWYDDQLFLSHLWKVLGAGGFSAEVAFGEPRVYADRRVAADATHDEIVAMREGKPCEAGAGMPVLE
jgi:1-acyl-sn-glycerol-3-phosphate acyltransferase